MLVLDDRIPADWPRPHNERASFAAQRQVYRWVRDGLFRLEHDDGDLLTLWRVTGDAERPVTSGNDYRMLTRGVAQVARDRAEPIGGVEIEAPEFVEALPPTSAKLVVWDWDRAEILSVRDSVFLGDRTWRGVAAFRGDDDLIAIAPTHAALAHRVGCIAAGVVVESKPRLPRTLARGHFPPDHPSAVGAWRIVARSPRGAEEGVSLFLTVEVEAENSAGERVWASAAGFQAKAVLAHALLHALFGLEADERVYRLLDTLDNQGMCRFGPLQVLTSPNPHAPLAAFTEPRL